MTANAMEGDRERCLAAGMDDYIAKPLRAEVLDAALARWVTPENGKEANVPVAPTNGSEENGPIDLETLQRLRSELGGSERVDALDAIIAQFLQSAPGRVAAISAAVDRDDHEAAGEEAHALKGASSIFGAVRLAVVCSAIEERRTQGDLAQARPLIRDLKEAAAVTQVTLETQLHGSAAART